MLHSPLRPRSRPLRGYLAAVVQALVIALVTTPLLGHLALPNIMPLFLIGVIVTSLLWGRGPGALASLAAVLCFHFFLTRPRFSLSVADSESLVSLAMMLAVSLVISEQSAALRKATQASARRAADIAMLSTLARALRDAHSAVHIEHCVNSVLHAAIGVHAQLLLPDSAQHLQPVDGELEKLGTLERWIAHGVWTSGHALRANPDLRDDALTLLLPLASDGVARGVLALHEPRSAPLPDLSDALSETLANLVTLALERTELQQHAPCAERRITRAHSKPQDSPSP